VIAGIIQESLPFGVGFLLLRRKGANGGRGFCALEVYPRAATLRFEPHTLFGAGSHSIAKSLVCVATNSFIMGLFV
jgi:hypothetical protein